MIPLTHFPNLPSSIDFPRSSSSINTQAIPRPTSLRPVARTRIPTLAIGHLGRRIGIAVPTITLIRILGPENLIALARRRAPFNRERVVVIVFILDDARGRGIRVAAGVAPPGDVPHARGTRGLVFEEREAVAGAAELGGVAGAWPVAFRVAFGGRGAGVGELVAAVAFRAVFHAEVGVARAVGRAGGVGVCRCGLGSSREDAGGGGVGVAALVEVA